MSGFESKEENRTRVGIVSMPFVELEIPSLAAGTLQSLLTDCLPDHQVTSHIPYVHYAESVGRPFYSLMTTEFMLGRAVFGMQLFPDYKPRVKEYFCRKLPEYLSLLEPTRQTLALDVLLDRQEGGSADSSSLPTSLFFQGEPAKPAELSDGQGGPFDYLDRLTAQFIDDAAVQLAADMDIAVFVVGSSAGNSYIESSLFSSLAVARKLKQVQPETTVILTGFGGISYGLREPLLAEFSFLDLVVEGEIEAQLLELIRGLPYDRDDPHRVQALDVEQLPAPDFSVFARWANDSPLLLQWSIPIESARGCWWDRVDREGDSFATCYFCNRHGGGYREKSPRRVADEMTEQAQRYGHSRFSFADSLVRLQDVEAVAREIETSDLPFTFLQHARAQITPYDILRLWEAGMALTQIGIEGLSTSFLRRIGKGTSTIQNLQAMKTLYELKITNVACNLLIDFPGATEAEVQETADTIRNFASIFQPLQASPFWLIRNSTVARNPEAFGITGLRNRDAYKMFLPDEVSARLPLPLMDFDEQAPGVSWQPVRQALAEWEELHREARRSVMGPEFHHTALLYYRDHGTCFEIIDRRAGVSVITLEKAWRDVYLFATQIRRKSEMERQFAALYGSDQIAEILESCVAARLMFEEQDRYLSLATTVYPHWAAQRIRDAHQASQRRQACDGHTSHGQPFREPAGTSLALARG